MQSISVLPELAGLRAKSIAKWLGVSMLIPCTLSSLEPLSSFLFPALFLSLNTSHLSLLSASYQICLFSSHLKLHSLEPVTWIYHISLLCNSMKSYKTAQIEVPCFSSLRTNKVSGCIDGQVYSIWVHSYATAWICLKHTEQHYINTF
jgi:hypothetical protein